jgi:RNA polymerase sigma-70 factor (ECF subfamily)
VPEGRPGRSEVRRGEKREASARRKAFATLHGEHASGIFNLALRLLGNREDAQDVCQDVLLKAYKRLGQGGELNQRAWLYRVTLNACYDQLRARKRKPSVPLESGFELDIPSTIDRCEQAELRRQVEEAFRRVPPAQRAALLLREIHGLHVHEVAFALGVKPASAEVTLVRARSSFRRHFAEISEPGVRWVAKGASDKRRAAKAAPRVGSHALVVGLPALALLKAAPLPACLDASSVLAAGSSAGIAGGVVAGAVAKIAAALTTKAAVVAIGATVVAGSAGGLYTVERASLVTHHRAGVETTSSRISPGVAAPQGQVAVTGTQAAPAGAASAPALAGSPSASPSAAPSPPPTPLVVGESGGSPSSTPSPSPTPTDTASATPTPSPTPTDTASAAPSPSPIPSPDPAPTSSPAP